MKICIENTGSFQHHFVATGISALLESPVFGLTYDTGHNAGGGFQQQLLIERHSERLTHMHLHDYSKTRGDHLPLGEGELNIAEYLRIAAKSNCGVVLEIKASDALRRSVFYLRERNLL